MGLLDISLTSSMRSTLFSLKDTSAKVERVQERLASGKKVMSALDNPTNYFAAQAALNRAGDLTERKDGIMEAIKNGDAANVGLKSLVSLLQTAKGIANSAHMAGASDRASLASQFNQILTQMDSLAGDSGYRGTNLLKKDDLTVNFNENGSSNLTINGVDATSSGLGIEKTYADNQKDSIAAGSAFSLALKSDGSVVAWGSNAAGQTTIPVAAQSEVVSITASGRSGDGFALALKNDGSVIGWGDNSVGQISIPTTAQSGVLSIAAGGNGASLTAFSIALKSDGSVIGWGSNSSGQTTIPASAQTGVIAIAAGESFALALKNDGSVVGWGSNIMGVTTIPSAVTSGVVAIAAGGYFALALKTDGSVVTWGDSTHGQSPLPSNVQSGVVSISAGETFGLALKSDGSVVAWGDNSAGQTNVPISAQSGVVSIASGGGYFSDGVSLALKNDGSVVAWGANNFGQATVPIAAQSGVMIPNSWSTDAGISKSEQQLESALSTLRTDAQTLSSNLSVIGVRKEFTDSMVANLQTGADNLTLADMNEEAANELMLQTRQNLGITSLSMAGQTARLVLNMF